METYAVNNDSRRLMDETSLAACEIAASDTVLVALSGGADSTALLLLMLEMRNEGRIGGLFAAHLNHGIRGAHALKDQRFCQTLCADLGVSFQTETCDAPAYAREHGLSLELAARELRYAFLERARIAFGADDIAIAHHANDQAETVLLHLLRGAGTSGLSGMKPRNGKVVRPLLRASRADILAYLAQRNAPFCEDETNAENEAARNRVRNELMPALQKENPAVVEALCKTAALCAEDDACLQRFANEAEEQLRINGGLDRAKLDALLQAVKSRIVRKRLLLLSGHVSEPDIRRVLALAKTQTGTRIELPGGFHAWTDASALYMGVYPETQTYSVPFVLEGKTNTPRGVLQSEFAEAWRKPASANEAFLSFDALPEGLVVRSRREGDRFFPLGAPGCRKLSDVFIDKKVPKEERDLPLLCAGNEVFYAAGLAISEKAKVEPSTRKILHITFYRG